MSLRKGGIRLTRLFVCFGVSGVIFSCRLGLVMVEVGGWWFPVFFFGVGFSSERDLARVYFFGRDGLLFWKKWVEGGDWDGFRWCSKRLWFTGEIFCQEKCAKSSR